MTNALIIGGGIAGTCTALALHKAGIRSEIFEARDIHSDGVGAFITLAVNGLAALRTIGVDVDALPGIPTWRMQIGMGDGTQLAAFPLGPSAGATGLRKLTRPASAFRTRR